MLQPILYFVLHSFQYSRATSVCSRYYQHFKFAYPCVYDYHTHTHVHTHTFLFPGISLTFLMWWCVLLLFHFPWSNLTFLGRDASSRFVVLCVEGLETVVCRWAIEKELSHVVDAFEYISHVLHTPFPSPHIYQRFFQMSVSVLLFWRRRTCGARRLLLIRAS